MKIKKRTPRLYNDYSNFEENPSDLSESKRVSKHLNYLLERGLPIPQKLRSSLEIQSKPLSEENHLLTSKKGRPPSIIQNSYLSMLVWYRCNIEKEKYTRSIERDIGRLERIAESINEKDTQSIRAALLDGKLSAVDITRDETNIRRLNKNFKNHGFIFNDSSTHNETQAEIFCTQILELSVEEAALYKQKLIDIWMENHFKSQGQ